MKRMMSPQSSRTHLSMENLEERCVPAGLNISADEQYFVELLNRARLDPAGEAARYGIDLNEGLTPGTITAQARQPLVANAALQTAIEGHVSDLLGNNYFSHTSLNGNSSSTRIQNAGYTNWSNLGENLAWTSLFGSGIDNVDELHQMLFVDANFAGRGHRTAMLNSNYREIGAAVLEGRGRVLGGQNFGAQANGGSFLTGVAFSDAVIDDNFYTPGEGLADITITAIASNGTVYTTTTSGSGGYSLQLPNGDYRISFRSDAIGTVDAGVVAINGQNVKTDLATDSLTVANFADGFGDAIDPVDNVTSTSIRPETSAGVSAIQSQGPIASNATPSTPLNAGRFAVGSEEGSSPLVRIYAADGRPVSEFYAFETSFRGGVRVATADVNADGVPDLIAVPGPGRATEVRIFDGVTHSLISRLGGFEVTYGGGLYVAAGDFTGDGRIDIAISADIGGGPRIKIYDGVSGALYADFLGIDDANFRGGARIGAGDLNGDGIADLAVGAGFGGGPRLAIYDGRTLGTTRTKLTDDFFVFESSLRNGAFVSLGDLNGDGKAELIVGGGPGGAPRVLALDGQLLVQSRGQEKMPLANFFVGDSQSRDGARVAAQDLNGDGKDELIAAGGNHVISADGASLTGGIPSRQAEFGLTGLTNGLGGVFVG